MVGSGVEKIRTYNFKVGLFFHHRIKMTKNLEEIMNNGDISDFVILAFEQAMQDRPACSMEKS